ADKAGFLQRIVIASMTRRISIEHRNENCWMAFLDRNNIAFTIAGADGNFDDWSVTEYISAIEIELRDDSSNPMMSLLTIPVSADAQRTIIRFDALYDLAFDQDEEFAFLGDLAVRRIDWTHDRKFTLLVNIKTENFANDAISSHVELAMPHHIPSVSLAIGEEKLSVSKELICLHSSFFEHLFNSSFMEKRTNHYELIVN
ncbi:hypothetical protein PENTCL1PPCAC_25839, partial [Pristionchus entomophagus]